MRAFNYNTLKQSIGGYLEINSPKIFWLLNKYKIEVKYLFAGGAAVIVNLLFLYFLTEMFGFWYVTSSVIAFFVSLLTGFFLQKFWTFRDKDVIGIKRQMAMYSAIGVLNLAIGPTLLYAFVEAFHIWYMLAQVLVMVVLAAESYLLNRFITFKKNISHESVNV